MVTVVEELPFVAVVDDNKLDSVCSNCFAVKGELNKIDLQKCDKCILIHYCSKKCQEEDSKFHKDECQFIATTFFFPSVNVRMMSRIIMRVKRGDLPVAFNGRTFDDLMDHKGKIVNSQHKQYNLYEKLLHFMGEENVPPFKEFLSLYGKRLVNSFCIKHSGVFNYSDSLGCALYLGIAAHNHSCRPTASYHFLGSKIVLLPDDPKSGYSKDLTVTYMPLSYTRKYRQDYLRSSYYFDCNCERCTDEELELLEQSGKSNCCPEDGAVLPIHRKFLWYWERPLVCTNCGKKADITLEQINQMNETVAEICAKEDKILADVRSKEDVDKLVKILDDAKLVLSPYNLNLLNLFSIAASASCIEPRNVILIKGYRFAEKKALEKYSGFDHADNVVCAVVTMKGEALEHFANHREIAFAKLDATCQKTLDVVTEAYGSEHPLCKEITQFCEMAKRYYDIGLERRAKKRSWMKEEETATSY